MEKIFAFEIYKFDYDLINHIKKLRMEKGAITGKTKLENGISKKFCR